VLNFVKFYYYYFDFSRYGQFDDAALVDGKPRNISFALLGDNSVSASMPHFWLDAGKLQIDDAASPTYNSLFPEMDPSYSVLVQTTSQDACGLHKKGTSTETILIAVLVSVFGVVIIVIAVYLIYPRIRLARKISKAGNSKSDTELMRNRKRSGDGGVEEASSSPRPIVIEKAQDMHAHTAA
jgi:hypothetical protein